MIEYFAISIIKGFSYLLIVKSIKIYPTREKTLSIIFQENVFKFFTNFKLFTKCI